MDNAILKLIDSSEPKDRKRAIKALIDDGSQEALKYLAIMYKTDSDPDIRELAVKAGRYIKKQQEAEQPSGGNAKWEGSGVKHMPEPPQRVQDKPEYVPVSPSKEIQAKSLLDQAMDASIARDKKRAFDLLKKAFQTNPNLRLDSFSMNMATDITGRDKEETLAMLGFGELPEDAVDEPGTGDDKAKRKRKNDEADSGEITWATALTDLTILYVVVAGVMIVGLILVMSSLVPVMNKAIQSYMASNPQASLNDPTTLQLKSLFGSMTGGIVIGVVYGLLYALVIVIGQLIVYVVVHLVATILLGGHGTLKGLIHHGNNVHLFFYAGSAALTFVVLLIVFSSFSDPAYLEAMQRGRTSDTGVLALVGTVSMIMSIVYLIWFGSAIGTNYEYGTTRGCVTIILTNLVFGALACAFGSAITAAIANLLR